MLELIGPGDGVLQYSQHISGGGAGFYAAVDRLDLEGMVSKRPDSVYVSSMGSAILVYMAKDFGPDLWPADLNNRRMGYAVLRWKAGLMSAANAVRVLRNPSLETEAELPGALGALFAFLDHRGQEESSDEGARCRCPVPVRRLYNPAIQAAFLATALNGWSIVKASGRIRCSIWLQVTGWAIGKPGRALGEKAPTAVLPRPLRR